MNNYDKNNRVILKGKICKLPEFSHTVLGEGFYELTLDVPRLSSESDKIPVTISERLLPQELKIGDNLAIIGQFRSYNKIEGEKSRLMLTVFTREIVDIPEYDSVNEIDISGFICKEPIYRTTPFGREITDILIAVNRAYNKSDYLPCIAWGRNAKFANELQVGEKVDIKGRVQSREYQKRCVDGDIQTRTAYEISIGSLLIPYHLDSEEIAN